MSRAETPFHLTGKHILVTGASSGIGRQCAISCSRMGAAVAIMGRNESRLEETLGQMENRELHLSYSVGLTDYDQVEAVVGKIREKWGKIHGIIHSAGISTTLPLRMITPEKMDEFFRVNVHGAIHLSRLATKKAFIPEGGASIVFITSVMAAVGESGKALYGMTKGALLAGSRSLAQELAAKKVRINCVSPGVVKTPMSENAVYSQDEASLERISSYHPLGLGEAEDVANACVFLLSDAARWITGTNLFVDGGYTAR